MNNLYKRVTTALILLLLVALAIYFQEQGGLLVLGTVITALATIEYQKMLLQKFATSLQVLFVLAAMTVFMTSLLHPHFTIIILMLAIMTVSLISAFKSKNIEEQFQFISYFVLGMFYTSLLFSSLCFMTLRLQNGTTLLLMNLLCVVANDVGAFIFGLWNGKTPLHYTSPNKTLEGSIAGLILSVLIGTITAYISGWNTNILLMTLLFFTGSLFSQFGDLFESLIKRVAGVKDSGKILPGHGGILDRLDSLVFSSPVFLAYAIFSGSTFV